MRVINENRDEDDEYTAAGRKSLFDSMEREEYLKRLPRHFIQNQI